MRHTLTVPNLARVRYRNPECFSNLGSREPRQTRSDACHVVFIREPRRMICRVPSLKRLILTLAAFPSTLQSLWSPTSDPPRLCSLDEGFRAHGDGTDFAPAPSL